MLEQENNKGFSIPKLSYSDILDIKHTRILVETEALRLSFEHGDVAWEASLVAAHHKLARLSLSLKDLEAWSEAHEEFHAILLSGSQSHYLIAFSIRLNLALDKYRRIAEPDQSIRDQLDAQHDELLQLALDRNINQAVEVLTSHITLSCQSAIDLLVAPNE
nr:FCD domain-containing protein [Vibrio sp. 99-70-13A1]